MLCVDFVSVLESQHHDFDCQVFWNSSGHAGCHSRFFSGPTMMGGGGGRRKIQEIILASDSKIGAHHLCRNLFLQLLEFHAMEKCGTQFPTLMR